MAIHMVHCQVIFKLWLFCMVIVFSNQYLVYSEICRGKDLHACMYMECAIQVSRLDHLTLCI